MNNQSIGLRTSGICGCMTLAWHELTTRAVSTKQDKHSHDPTEVTDILLLMTKSSIFTRESMRLQVTRLYNARVALVQAVLGARAHSDVSLSSSLSISFLTFSFSLPFFSFGANWRRWIAVSFRCLNEIHNSDLGPLSSASSSTFYHQVENDDFIFFVRSNETRKLFTRERTSEVLSILMLAMHSCHPLVLFFTGLKAATIHKLNARTDLCDPLVSECSDFSKTFGVSYLDLPSYSRATLAGAPNLANSPNTDVDPELQTSNGNDASSPIGINIPSAQETTQSTQPFNTAMNIEQNMGDVTMVPTTAKDVDLETLPKNAWDVVHGGWWGSCHIFGVGCRMCYTSAGDVKTDQLCRDASLLGHLPNHPNVDHNLCVADGSSSPAPPQICIAHDPASDDTPAFPAPTTLEPGEWGYCDEQGLHCALCWKHESGESTGCVPAVPRVLTSDYLPAPSKWLCFKGAEASLHSCVKPMRWFQTCFSINCST